MICKLCNRNRKLIKAHIIPEAFFRLLRKGQIPPRLYTAGDYPKKRPVGIWDQTILCESCENKFGEWDDYAQNLLIQNFQTARQIKSKMGIEGYIIDNYNYDKLKLFFIAILWRASVSAQDFYSEIQLGYLGEKAKNHIETKRPGSPDDFSVLLARSDEQISKLSMLNPCPIQLDGVTFCQFYLTRYIAYIKTDERFLSGTLRNFIMSPNKELGIILRDFKNSDEQKVLSNIIRNTKK